MARLAAVSTRDVQDGGARGLASGRRVVRTSTAAATKRSVDEKAHKCNEKDVPRIARKRLAAAPADSEGKVSTDSAKYDGKRDWVQYDHSMPTEWLDFALIDANGEGQKQDHGEFYQETTQAVRGLMEELRGGDLADIPGINVVVNLSSDLLVADDTSYQSHTSGCGSVGSNSVSHGWLYLPDLNVFVGSNSISDGWLHLPDLNLLPDLDVFVGSNFVSHDWLDLPDLNL